MEVDNVAPSALTLNLASSAINVGGTASLSGGFADPGTLDSHTVTIAWGDGATGTVNLAAGVLTYNATHVYSVSSSSQPGGKDTISVTVVDKDGGTIAGATTIQVNSVQPVAGLSGPTAGVRGQPLTFTLNANDPVAANQQAGFTFNINWGDGTRLTVSGGSGLALDHAYTTEGVYTIQLTATDQVGLVSTIVSQQETITPTAQIGGTFYVGGTTGDDLIAVTPLTSSSFIIFLNGCITAVAGVNHVVVFGQAGNDNISVNPCCCIRADLYGGDGDDVLAGGAGPTILDGGNGNDILYGGSGPSVLIGGNGMDILQAGSGGAILLGGNFNGSTFADRSAALDTVIAEWASSDAYAKRVSTLAPIFASRVSDDAASDILSGGQGLDWYFASLTGSTKDTYAGYNAKLETLTKI